MEKPDQDTIVKFRDGDQEAFRRIIEYYQQKIYRLGLRLFNDPHGAADFAQDAFIRIYEKRRLYDPNRVFEPWLFTVAINLGRTSLRRKHWQELLLGEHTPEVAVGSHVEQDLIADEDRDRVWAAVRRLPYAYRETLALRFESGLSLEAIAKIKNIPLGTVKSQLSRGLKKFVQQYRLLEGGTPCSVEEALNG